MYTSEIFLVLWAEDMQYFDLTHLFPIFGHKCSFHSPIKIKEANATFNQNNLKGKVVWQKKKKPTNTCDLKKKKVQ